MAEAHAAILLAVAVAATMGFGWLALAMDAHWRQVRGGAAPRRGTRATLRLLGLAGLSASALLSVAADGPGIGTLVWLMLLAAGATATALALAWRPRLLRVLWPRA